MNDIVERLRNYRIGCGIHCSHYHTLEPLDECVEAADEIERLSARLAEVERERDEARRQRNDEIKYSLKRIGAALEDKYAAEARAERLESALREARTWVKASHDNVVGLSQSGAGFAKNMLARIDAAIASPKQEG